MFATISGPYPWPAGLADDAFLELALGDQLEADLGMLADGLASPADDPVAAWSAADACARRLATERDVAPRAVKARLRGPYSAGRRAGGGASSRERTTLAAAEAANLVLRLLLSAGAQVVQVEEDGLTSIGPDDEAERSLAGEALRRLTDGVAGHLSLSVVGGDPCGAGARVLYDAPFSSHVFDLIAGPDGWRVAREAPGDRGLIVGVADCRAVEADDAPVMLWAARYAASFGRRGLERVALTTSAGLERLPRAVARAKLGGLAAAAALAAIRDREALRDGLEFQALTRSAPPGRRPLPRRRPRRPS